MLRAHTHTHTHTNRITWVNKLLGLLLCEGRKRWIDGETKICILLRKVRTFLGSEDIWLVQRHIFVKLFKNENILLVWG